MSDIPESESQLVQSSEADPGVSFPSAALREVEEELAAIPREKVLTINCSMKKAYPKILGTAKLRARLRPLVVAHLGALVDVRLFDRLDLYARAAVGADLEQKRVGKTSSPTRPEVEKLRWYRDVLSTAVNLTMKMKLGPPLARKMKRRPGALNAAYDVAALAGYLEENKASLKPDWPLSREELDGAWKLSEEVIRAVARRKGNKDQDHAGRDRRNRAFTLLMRAYDEVKRVVTFLCWQDPNLDSLVPSLNAEPHKKRKKKPAAVAAEETSVEASPLPVPALGPVTTTRAPTVTTVASPGGIQTATVSFNPPPSPAPVDADFTEIVPSTAPKAAAMAVKPKKRRRRRS